MIAGSELRWDCDVLLSDGHPVHLRPARPDDRDGVGRERVQRSAIPERRRDVGRCQERRRESRIVPRKQMNAGGFRTLAHGPRLCSAGLGTFDQHRIAGAKPFCQTHARQIWD